jgi:hypothetical protein
MIAVGSLVSKIYRKYTEDFFEDSSKLYIFGYIVESLCSPLPGYIGVMLSMYYIHSTAILYTEFDLIAIPNKSDLT